MLVHIGCPELWHIPQPGLDTFPDSWITSPIMWIHLSISNKCPNQLLTFKGFPTLWWLPFAALLWELNHSFVINECFNNRFSFLSTSHCAYIDSAMIFAVHSVISSILSGSTNKVTISIMLLVQHTASGHFVLLWEQYFSVHKLVPPLWDYLLISSNMGNISAFCDFPHMDQTEVCPLHPLQLSLSTQSKDPVSGVKMLWMSYVWLCTLPVPSLVGLVLGMWTCGGPDHSPSWSLPWRQTNIYAWAQVSTQSEMIMGVWCTLVPKHYPFKPFKLLKTGWCWMSHQT